ncbi:MAG: hypothetical protein OMOMHJEC_01600 [Xanthomonadales bacterium]|nr:hypothetical protein [Xanthomonadales bacterium]
MKRVLTVTTLACAIAAVHDVGAQSITGTVSSQAGPPVTTGFVRIHNAAGTLLGSALIGSNGTYSFGGLAPGNYFARTTSTGFFDELWSDIPCAQGNCVITSGTPIGVSGNAVAANFVLVPGGSIAGTVSSATSGQPLNTGFVRVFGNTGTLLGSALIGSNGTYVYGGLAAGTYYARTTSTNYFDELWNDIPCAQGNCVVTSGTPIIVGSTQVTANFGLVPGGSIGGTVTSSSTGFPVTTGFVRVFGPTGTLLGSALISSQGQYSYGGLAPGSYFARTTSTGLIDELWDNIPCPQGNCVVTSGTAITVGSGPVLTNFSLDAEGGIAGSIVSTATGQPVTSGFVRIHNSSGTLLGSALIGASGNYSYGGLDAGTYFARTASTGYLDELWNNRPCAQGNCVVTQGDPIVVGTAFVTANFSLASGGGISGLVTSESTGFPITTGFVRVYDSGGGLLGSALIAADGQYSYGGLAAGTYFARTVSTGAVDELFNNIPCAQGACVITQGTPISVGTSTVGVNFQLITSGPGADQIFSNGFEAQAAQIEERVCIIELKKGYGMCADEGDNQW